MAHVLSCYRPGATEATREEGGTRAPVGGDHRGALPRVLEQREVLLQVIL